MKKFAIIFVILTLFYTHLFAHNDDQSQEESQNYLPSRHPRRYGMPYIGDIVKAAQREETSKYHSHQDGVYYENVTHEFFSPIDYFIQPGSLKLNMNNIAKKYGWKIIWNLDTDYDVPVGFPMKHTRVPEIFAELIFHLPIKIMFYTKNKVIFIEPMFDKRETDVGHKYSINPRG
jgi:hypothetical protein